MTQLSDDCFAFGGALMTAAEALAILQERIVTVTGAEQIALPAALGRILARDQVAPMDVPPHDNAAVDGYALRSVDLAAAGLRRIDARNQLGESEALFLDPLYEILDRGTSPGRALIERWDGAFQRRIDRLVEYAKY